MGKRSSFKRSPRDYYPTPRAAVAPLLPWLAPRTRFCEPCAGAGHLIESLETAGHRCIAAYDISPGNKTYIKQDAIKLKLRKTDCFITNPPWERDTLHAIIDNLASQHPTWLLIDADWMHTRQAADYWRKCSLIVSVGRVKWIPDSPHTGKDNCCWYKFEPDYQSGPRFIGRS